MANRARSWALDATAVVLLLAAGAHLRLGRLGAALVNGDSIGPYWKAATILDGGGWLPRSHAPESGPALYWLSTPFVALADSLDDAYAARFLAQALVAPLIYMAVRLAKPVDASRVPAFLAASALALSAGLRQTLESGYQGYLSIEVAAFITVCFAAARPAPAALGLIAVPVAMMCHPLAAAYLLPAVVAAVVVARSADLRGRILVTLGALVALGIGALRLRQLAGPAFDSGTFDFAAVAAIPGGNDTGVSAVGTLWSSLAGIPDQDGIGWPVPSALLTVLCLLAVPRLGSRLRTPSLFAASAVVVSLAGLGAAIGYLQPYHWRIVAPAVLAALAITATPFMPRLPPWAMAVPALLLLARTALPWGPPISGPSDLDRHTAVSRLTQDAGWIEFGTVGDQLWGSPAAVRLSQRLRGGDVPMDRPVHLVIAGPEDVLRGLPTGEGVHVVTLLPGGPETALLLVRLADPRASEAWTERVCGIARLRIERRAVDYLGFERPDLTEPFISMWWDRCTGANVGW